MPLRSKPQCRRRISFFVHESKYSLGLPIFFFRAASGLDDRFLFLHTPIVIMIVKLDLGSQVL